MKRVPAAVTTGVFIAALLVLTPAAASAQASPLPGLERSTPAKLEDATLIPAGVGPGDGSGGAACLSGTLAVVGASRDDDRGTDAGAAHVFEKIGGTWVQAPKLLASDGASSELFGYAVSISGDVAVVTAYLDDHVAWWGSTSVADLRILPVGSGTPGTGGVVPSLQLSGHPEVGNTLSVAIQGGQPGAAGTLRIVEALLVDPGVPAGYARTNAVQVTVP